MQITLNTEELTEADRQVLALLAGGASAPAVAEAAPKPAAKKATTPKAEPKPEPAAEPASDGPTLEDAVAAATKLVSTGEAAKVKAALADVGAKRVSELAEEDIPGFLDALNA